MIRLLKIAIFTLFCLSASAQNFDQVNLKAKIEQPRFARIMFYNCENLFDYLHDSLKLDEEFLPGSVRNWSKTKYFEKLKKTAKVIASAGAWSPVELIGLCEIENHKVLHDLTRNTQLYLYEYQFIHNESPDKRGIDVALLYQPKIFTPLNTEFIAVQFNDSLKTTREILYAKGILHNTDTVHVFVNHWPSRWGGQLESEPYRVNAAITLRNKVDSIVNSSFNANIIVIGDFNDTPTDQSISKFLCKNSNADNIQNNQLYNLAALSDNLNKGTHKYHGVWTILDQIIVTGNLLQTDQKLHISQNSFVILNHKFLLEKDEKYLGYKPFRTFVGFKFNNGYSDHLPVYIDIQKD